MGISSVRFNSQEEKVLKILARHFHCDNSTIIKKSLFELYEDVRDRELIETFENKESKGKVKFYKSTDILE